MPRNRDGSLETTEDTRGITTYHKCIASQGPDPTGHWCIIPPQSTDDNEYSVFILHLFEWPANIDSVF